MTDTKLLCSSSIDDQEFFEAWSPTDEECLRIKQFHEFVRPQVDYGDSLKFQYGKQPCIVLDDFLFLGNIRHASNLELLEQFKIEHIINVCETDLSTRLPPNRFDIVQIPFDDSHLINIKQHFERTNELLHTYYTKHERCLVNCAGGVSRSVTIILAYLMKYHHDTLKDAFQYLTQKRPQIWPNQGFLLQLIRYENELIKSREIIQTSTSIDTPLSDGTKHAIETIE